MTDRLRRTALPAALVLLSLAAAPAAHALPVTVNLRVEGPTKTVFDGPVTTDGHDVTTAKAGTHPCDGTNGGSEPEPGPTATAALDDAAKLAGFTIDGPYGNFGIEDFFLERVADQQIDPSTGYWSLWINHGFSDKGGCQKRVLAGQDVLWAGVPFSVDVPLKLDGTGHGHHRPAHPGAGDGRLQRRGAGGCDRRRQHHRPGRQGHARLPRRGHLPAQGGEARHDPLQHDRAVRGPARRRSVHLHGHGGAGRGVRLRRGRPSPSGARAREPQRALAHDPRVVGRAGRRRQRRPALLGRGESGEGRRGGESEPSGARCSTRRR